VGDELRDGAPDGICDANRAMLLSWCVANGMTVSDLGVLPDQRSAIASILAEAAVTHDAVISSAGTSAGDEDHLRGAMLDCGGNVLVAGVAIRPGKPVTFGQIDTTLIAALPGNPAAAFVTFFTLGLPLLRQIAGALPTAPRRQKVCAAFSHRKKTGMREYLRVTLNRTSHGLCMAQASAKGGSAMLTSLRDGDGLVCLDEELGEVKPGMLIDFQSFRELMAL
jgi:molybdopterin molybdotransferase